MPSSLDIPTLKVGFMHLHKIFCSPKSATGRSLSKFRQVLQNSKVWRPKEDVQFVFLCGANARKGIPSKRRQMLLDFASEKLPNSRFFLAESIFEFLKSTGYTSNFLDIENELSAFSDYVVIILESESAFCELGAFASHYDLRKKLIVINDKKHINSRSFINIGPIEAVLEVSSGKNVLYYSMDKHGKLEGDAIGDVFYHLQKLIHKTPRTRRTRVKRCDPNLEFSKNSLRLVHDLVFFTGPISMRDFKKVVKLLFAKCKENEIKKHLGLLSATDQIVKTAENGYYISTFNKPFFEYDGYDVYDLLASFKNLYFKYDPDRMK